MDADDSAGEAHQDRCEGFPALRVCDIPTGRGRGNARLVRSDPRPHCAGGNPAATGGQSVCIASPNSEQDSANRGSVRTRTAYAAATLPSRWGADALEAAQTSYSHLLAYDNNFNPLFPGMLDYGRVPEGLIDLIPEYIKEGKNTIYSENQHYYYSDVTHIYVLYLTAGIGNQVKRYSRYARMQRARTDGERQRNRDPLRAKQHCYQRLAQHDYSRHCQRCRECDQLQSCQRWA